MADNPKVVRYFDGTSIFHLFKSSLPDFVKKTRDYITKTQSQLAQFRDMADVIATLDPERFTAITTQRNHTFLVTGDFSLAERCEIERREVLDSSSNYNWHRVIDAANFIYPLVIWNLTLEIFCYHHPLSSDIDKREIAQISDYNVMTSEYSAPRDRHNIGDLLKHYEEIGLRKPVVEQLKEALEKLYSVSGMETPEQEKERIQRLSEMFRLLPPE